MTHLSFVVNPSLILDDLFLEMVAGMELEGGQDVFDAMFDAGLEDTHQDPADSSNMQ